MLRDEDVRFYTAHADALMRFAGALVGPADAHDLVTTTVLRALTSPAWDRVDNKRAYLYRSLTNAAHAQRRAEHRRHERERRVAMAEVSTSKPADPDVHRALRELTARQRAVVFLTYWLDQTPADVAEALGLSRRTVERELTLARRHLEALLS